MPVLVTKLKKVGVAIGDLELNQRATASKNYSSIEQLDLG